MSSPGSAAPQAEFLITIATHLRVGKYIQLAGFVILIYDHVLTFPRELERIWRQKLTGASLLFLLNRYITPFQYIVIITGKVIQLSSKPCDDFVQFEGALSGAMSSTAVWVSPLVIDTTIFLLTLWRTRQYLKLSERIPVLNIFVRDGIMYFFTICLMNLANALLFFLGPESLKPVLAPFSAMMTAMLISRLILNLRSSGSTLGATNTVSPTRMTPRRKDTVILDTVVSMAIGNLGEDFETSSERSTSSQDHEDYDHDTDWNTRSRPSIIAV
ncbi:hypothetical protein NLJ89_g7729 [Agrocybe chaxingu]|uniref:DUF6533 domain-containing protein n=1 Tax=Agrocybe chaxingu TaxID=84603 RepID=A0A9W8K3U9_9AGAR|nr:hypothetical protein NLJ89_g7729 [Agrocybe chaxingu]